MPDDTLGMLRTDFDPLQRHPACLAALQAYWETHQDFKKNSPNFDGWINRLTNIAEVAPESLSATHGKLIAFGYLKFELTAKDATLRYQLTPLGRSAVTGESPVELAAEDLALSA